MTVALKIGGHWHSPRTHTRPIYETLADGGMGEASFQLLLPPYATPLGVERHALVEMIEDSQRVYLGRIDSIDPERWAITCIGIRVDLDGIPALTAPLSSGGAMTRDAAVAIATANAAPFNAGVGNARGITGVAFGDTTEPVMVGALLDMLCEQEGGRWGIDADWQLYLRDDPTKPKWIIHAPKLHLTDQGGQPYNMYFGRYVDYTTGLYATAFSNTPSGNIRASHAPGLVERGQMSALDASVILNRLVQDTRSTPTWGSVLTVSPGQILNSGMEPAALSEVRGGDMGRLIGLTASQQAVAGGEYLDVVLKSVVRDTGADSLTIAPVGTLPTSLEEAFARIQ